MDAISTAAAALPAANLDKRSYVHTLSLRLTDDQYRRLRRFTAAYEEKYGRRLTHQAVLEAALYQFLEKHKDQPI